MDNQTSENLKSNDWSLIASTLKKSDFKSEIYQKAKRDLLEYISKNQLWSQILTSLYPPLSLALKLAPNHVACPIHGGVDGFRFFSHFLSTGACVCNTCGSFGNGLKLLSFIKKTVDTEEAKKLSPNENGILLSIVSLLSSNKLIYTESNSSTEDDFSQQRRDVIYTKEKLRKNLTFNTRVFKESTIDTLPALKYLLSRGIPFATAKRYASLSRWHSGKSLQFSYHEKNGDKSIKVNLGEKSFFFVPVTDIWSGKICFYQRYYVDANGKTFPDIPKAYAKKATAFSFVPPDEDAYNFMIVSRESFTSEGTLGKLILHVAEGFETAAAVSSVIGDFVHSTINSVYLSLLTPQNDVGTIVVWADKDRKFGGEKAAEKLIERMSKIRPDLKIIIYFPPMEIEEGKKSCDWLDVLNQFGSNPFPSKWRKVNISATKP